MPKLAITGKGGVGKTTLTALLSYIYGPTGQGCDRDRCRSAGNLGLAFGLSAAMDADLKPIAEMGDLIYERTGAQPGTVGGWFRLNPKVDDIPRASASCTGASGSCAWGVCEAAEQGVSVQRMHCSRRW